MTNPLKKYIKYKEKYLNLKKNINNNLYGGAPKFIHGLGGEEVHLEYDDETTIEDIKKQFIRQQRQRQQQRQQGQQRQHDPFRYWFLISIVKGDDHIYDNNIKLVDLLDTNIDTTFNIIINSYDDYDIELLDLINRGETHLFLIDFVIYNLSDKLLDNEAFLLFLITVYRNHEASYYNRIIPDKYKNDTSFVIKAIKLNGDILQYVSNELQANKDVVLSAVQQNSYMLQYASVNIRDDKDIVMKAVTNYGTVLKFASSKLRADKEVVLAAIKNDAAALAYTSSKIRANKEIILAAVKQNGLTLEYASNYLRYDKYVVLTAVTQNGFALEYASPLDKDNGGWAIQDAPENLRDNKKIVLAAVTQNGKALQYASIYLQDDKEIVLTAIRNDYKIIDDYQGHYAFLYASDRLKYDTQVISAAIQQYGKDSIKIMMNIVKKKLFN
jgi:hypothetical protein